MRKNYNLKPKAGKALVPRQPLPLPANNSGALPELPEWKLLAAVLAEYTYAVNHDWKPASVKFVENMRVSLPEIRQRWAKYDRQATYEEVYTQLGHLINSDDHLRNNDLWAEKIADRVVAKQPTRYALFVACDEIGDNEDWLTRPKLMRALRAAEADARDFREALDRDPQQWLLEAERDRAQQQKLDESDARYFAQREAEFVKEYGMSSDEYYYLVEGCWADDVMADRSEPARQRMTKHWAQVFGEDGHG